jgi:hypothetical protein
MHNVIKPTSKQDINATVALVTRIQQPVSLNRDGRMDPREDLEKNTCRESDDTKFELFN